MKKVKGLLVGIVLWVVLMGCMFVEQYYARTVEVVKVEGQEITVEDDYKHQWIFFGEGFAEGQEIKVLMNTNTTDNNILDDEIIRVIE
jgi:hypothetical protein